MDKHIKWFDLSRFGAALRIIPASPLRGGISISCFEIRDRRLFEERYIGEASLDNKKTALEQFISAREELGFRGTPIPVSVIDDETTGFSQYLRLFSTKTEFTLNDLRKLCPSLDQSDLKYMPIEGIRLDDMKGTMVSEWKDFSNRVLSIESKGVWTPKDNPYEKPYTEAASILVADPSKVYGSQPHPLLNNNNVSIYYGLSDKLHKSQYRENALISYYVDRESSLKDGWREDEIRQVDLPYALPIWLSESGRIVALRDIRYAPEIMDLPPKQYFSVTSGGLIVGALRGAKDIESSVKDEVAKWRKWANDPSSLNNADIFFHSVDNIVSGVETLRKNYPRITWRLSELLEADRDDSKKDSSTKPLTELTDWHMQALAKRACQIVGLSEPESKELGDSLTRILKSCHDIVAIRARDIAKLKMQELAGNIQKGDSEERGSGKEKHVDAGEKIGGARKDFARRSMTVEDLVDMNEMERHSLVTKKNVWPPLDYQQMRDDGVTPQAAMAIKYLKDSLNTAPTSNRDPHEDAADYIRAIGIVRDRVADVATLEQFTSALIELYEDGCGGKPDEKRKPVYGHTCTQIQWGQDASHLIFSGHQGGIPRLISREIHRKVIGYDQSKPIDEQWRNLIKPKRVKTDIQLEEEREKQEREKRLHRPHLAKAERSGTDFRSGKDVTAHDLMDHFKFRAVEFGNWLPQDERQIVLNMAFDSFCDLAEGLDLPPEAISLGNDLAIAFGSRGRGGKIPALAHYEPARNVINLTRLSGAGALAHEWMHAFDFHLADKKGFASEVFEKIRSDSMMSKISWSMRYRPATEIEIEQKALKNAERGKSNALSWLYQQDSDERLRHRSIMEEFFIVASKEYRRAAQNHIKTNRDRDEYKRDTYGLVHKITDWQFDTNERQSLIDRLRDSSSNRRAFTKSKDNLESNIVYMLQELKVYALASAARELDIQLPVMFKSGNLKRETRFLSVSSKHDEERSKPYWSSTREMFARAGECYIYDKVVGNDKRSDYLVFGVDDSLASLNDSDFPYPTGEERMELKKHFDNLLDGYRMQFIMANERQSDVAP